MSIIKLNNRGVKDATAFGSITSLGSFTFISKQTASSSANVDFTSGLDSTYKVYYLTFNNVHPQTSGQPLKIQFRDGGSNFDATIQAVNFSQYHAEDGSATSLYNETDSDAINETSLNVIRNLDGETADGCGSGYIWIFNPSDTTFVTNFNITASYVYGGSYGAFHDKKDGYINVTSAIDGIRFNMGSGNIDSGEFCLYGIK